MKYEEEMKYEISFMIIRYNDIGANVRLSYPTKSGIFENSWSHFTTIRILVCPVETLPANISMSIYQNRGTRFLFGWCL